MGGLWMKGRIGGVGKRLEGIGRVRIGKGYGWVVICGGGLKIKWEGEFKKFGGKNGMIVDDGNKGRWEGLFESKWWKILIRNYE